MPHVFEFPNRVALAGIIVAFVGCAGTEPPVISRTTRSGAQGTSGQGLAPIEPADVEPPTPAGFTPRTYAELPAPDALAAREDLPDGFTCRVGSDRMGKSRRYQTVVFASADRLYLEALGDWTVVDAATGAAAENFSIGIVTSGVSPSGTCIAALREGTQIELVRLPSRESSVKRAFPDDDYNDVVPADDCSSAIQNRGACVRLFDASLAPNGEVCAGTRLGAVALSNDGRRVALVPSSMSEYEYGGDGIHVFDTRTKVEVALVRKKNESLGEVVLSRDGGLVAFVDGKDVRIVALPSGEAVSTFTLPEGASVQALVLSPSAKRLAVSLRREVMGLVMVDVATGRPLFTQWGLPLVAAVAFSPDGTRLAHTAEGSGARIIDTFTGEDHGAGGLFEIRGGALSGRGDRAVVSSAGHLTVWDTRDCSRIAAWPNTPSLDRLVVVPDGASAIGVEGSRIVRVDLGTGTRTSRDLGPLRGIYSLGVAPDGKRAFVGLQDDDERWRVAIVDLTTMRVLKRVVIPGSGMIVGLIFAPDGKKLHAAAFGGYSPGDSRYLGTNVIEVDAGTGALGRRFMIPGATDDFSGAVLEQGRIIVINGAWRTRTTGKELPLDERRLFAVSSDRRTALWGDLRSVFAWAVDEPLPASPTATTPMVYGTLAVSREALLQCDYRSCLVARVAGSAATTR